MVPDRRLVWTFAVPAAFAFASLFWPAWLWTAGAALAVALALTGIDFAQSRNTRAPSLECRLPRRGRVGSAAGIELRLHNPNAAPIVAQVLVELPADLGGDVALGPHALRPGATHATTISRTPQRRGLRPIGTPQILTRSRLGLMWSRSAPEPPEPFPVLPAPGLAEAGALVDSRAHARPGIRPRRPRGEGLEFESLREYVPGDDPRHLDWRASARTGKLISRQYRIERNHSVVVCVDTSRLMSARIDRVSKLDHSLVAGLALAGAVQSAGDRVGLAAFDREVRAWVAPIGPRAALTPFLDATLPLEVSPVEPTYRVLADLLARYQKKRALVIILTDFVEGASSASLESYLSLLARRHCVLLVACRDPLLSSLGADPGIGAAEVYRRLVIQDLVVERQTALERIRRMGVQTLDLQPDQMTAPLLASYLEIRQRGLL